MIFIGNYKVNINGINTSNLKVLKKGEMEELFNKYHSGDINAKEELINGNLKLVLSIIKNYNNGKNDMNDLFQVGVVGLIKAVDNFDLSFNVMFSTYAVPLILGEVKRYIRDMGSIRVTRSIRDLAYHIMKYKDAYLEKYGIEASNEEICKALGISEYELGEALSSLRDTVSIYDPIYNDGGDTIYLIDQLGENENVSKDDLISLRTALLNINEKEKDIILKRFFLGYTQSELANVYNVSQAQISRMERKAIDDVKKLIK